MGIHKVFISLGLLLLAAVFLLSAEVSAAEDFSAKTQVDHNGVEDAKYGGGGGFDHGGRGRDFDHGGRGGGGNRCRHGCCDRGGYSRRDGCYNCCYSAAQAKAFKDVAAKMTTNEPQDEVIKLVPIQK
ncbi:hypothetical protein MKX01_005368 [Papaver californicum]|nr:hypothetical protein MKX01_005368 [Papaver californicum]